MASCSAAATMCRSQVFFTAADTGKGREVLQCTALSVPLLMYLYPNPSTASPAAPARVVTLPADTMRMTLLPCTQAREAHLISACRETDSNTSPLLSFQ